jgi:hypothetical protein
MNHRKLVVDECRLLWQISRYLFRLLNSHGATGFGIDQSPRLALEPAYPSLEDGIPAALDDSISFMCGQATTDRS